MDFEELLDPATLTTGLFPSVDVCAIVGRIIHVRNACELLAPLVRLLAAAYMDSTLATLGEVGYS